MCCVLDCKFKLAELEAELQKQREARTMYKMKLERTQDYLRNCLQIAQENDLLDIITGNKRDKDKQDSQTLLSPNVITSNITPQTPLPSTMQSSHPHSSLAALIDQAMILGWYIEPHEVRTSPTMISS